MFAVADIIVFAALAGVLAAGATAALPWTRRHGRFLVVGLATAAGFIAWNLTLNATHATGFNTDAPAVRLSWADSGSAVLAFVVTTAALAVTNRREFAGRVVATAALAGAVAAVVDIFVL